MLENYNLQILQVLLALPRFLMSKLRNGVRSELIKLFYHSNKYNSVSKFMIIKKKKMIIILKNTIICLAGGKPHYEPF